MRQTGRRRVILGTDPGRTDSESVVVTLEALRGAGMDDVGESIPLPLSCMVCSGGPGSRPPQTPTRCSRGPPLPRRVRTGAVGRFLRWDRLVIHQAVSSNDPCGSLPVGLGSHPCVLAATCLLHSLLIPPTSAFHTIGAVLSRTPTAATWRRAPLAPAASSQGIGRGKAWPILTARQPNDRRRQEGRPGSAVDA
jgi:hypothetical protein